MRTILLAAGASLAALSATVSAQGDAPAAPAPACYIEIRQLMAEPPAGTGDLAAALRALDTALRPQAVEINTLKAQLARLEQREVVATPATSLEAAFAEEDDPPQSAPPASNDRTAEDIRRVQAEIEAKQAKLKLDYAAQQQTLIGPVQARINRGAQTFAASSGCAELKMARAPDLAALSAAGARNVTGEFVAWYLANPPA
jgi:Skp family chaperone for outer membrane proteins